MIASATPQEHAGHTPVMLRQVLELLDPQAGQVVIDATTGRGGHASAIMPRLAPGGRYIGLDVDPANLQFVRQQWPDPPVTLKLVQANFAEARATLDELGLEAVDGLLADLGFASTQMADPQRGFSFTREGPLDMRLDPTLDTTAADLLARLPQHELADLIWRYGEERLSRKIARKIVDSRHDSPITTTSQLAQLCAEAYGSKQHRMRLHPATRTFQALRIAVNGELERLQELLDQVPQLVRPGGVAVMISFHSLEDRLIKRTFRQLANDGRGTLLTKKPLRPDAAERAANRRSRSAKCRAIRVEAPSPADRNR